MQDDGLKRARAAKRFQMIAVVLIVALIASVYLGPQYSLFGLAFPGAITAVTLYYFYHRTPQNTDQAVIILGALLLIVTWYCTLANVHDRRQDREVERLACQGTRGEGTTLRCAEIRDALNTPLFPRSDDP